MDPQCNNPETRHAEDATQPWLDFGGWLAGENAADPTAPRDGVLPDRAQPFFARIVELYFSDIGRAVVPPGEQEPRARGERQEWAATETRQAMHRRFIGAVHLAFGSEDLRAIAAREPAPVFRLVEHIRSDFGLLPPGQNSREHPLRFLHLEDSAGDAEIIQAILREEWPTCRFQRVWTRPDYEKALRGGGFNLILSDHTMPGFDGLSALELALQHTPEKPFIFLSGTLGEERAVEAVKRGAADYVFKDHPNRLVSVIREALARQ